MKGSSLVGFEKLGPRASVDPFHEPVPSRGTSRPRILLAAGALILGRIAPGTRAPADSRVGQQLGATRAPLPALTFSPRCPYTRAVAQVRAIESWLAVVRQPSEARKERNGTHFGGSRWSLDFSVALLTGWCMAESPSACQGRSEALNRVSCFPSPLGEGIVFLPRVSPAGFVRS